MTLCVLWSALGSEPSVRLCCVVFGHCRALGGRHGWIGFKHVVERAVVVCGFFVVWQVLLPSVCVWCGVCCCAACRLCQLCCGWSRQRARVGMHHRSGRRAGCEVAHGKVCQAVLRTYTALSFDRVVLTTVLAAHTSVQTLHRLCLDSGRCCSDTGITSGFA